MRLLACALVLLSAVAVQALTLTWYQTPATPGVSSYNLYVNVTPVATWPSSEATPAGTNAWKHECPGEPNDIIQLQSCNCPWMACCSDLSNTKVVPTLTPTRTPTPSLTPTTTRTIARPQAPILWDVH